MIKTKKQMFLVIGAFAAILFLGTVTYAFFSYTREGTANLVQAGRISFSAVQGTAINLTNAFPISSSNINSDATNVGSVTIHVTGDTTYDDGVEYLVRATNVLNTIGVNDKKLPISINVSVGSITEGEVPNQTTTNLGTADDSYFTNRGGNSSIYKILAKDTISNNDQLLVGYIAKGATGVNGNIIIKAYFDEANILISDTDTDANKTVFTTSEWNSLQTYGVSFQVNVVAKEGVWVTAPRTSATFDVGSVVNTKLKLLLDNQNYTGQDWTDKSGYQFTNGDKYIRIFERAQVSPNLSNLSLINNVISSSSSETPIYAWVEVYAEDQSFPFYIAYWYTDASDVYLNEDSSKMFKKFSWLYSLPNANTINASRTENMSEMFYYSSNGLNYSDISSWNVSSVTNMSKMFAYTFAKDASIDTKDASVLNGWDVRNVQNFTNMFFTDDEMGNPSNFTYPLFTLRPGTWDNTPSVGEWGFNEYAGTYVPNN